MWRRRAGRFKYQRRRHFEFGSLHASDDTHKSPPSRLPAPAPLPPSPRQLNALLGSEILSDPYPVSEFPSPALPMRPPSQQRHRHVVCPLSARQSQPQRGSSVSSLPVAYGCGASSQGGASMPGRRVIAVVGRCSSALSRSRSQQKHWPNVRFISSPNWGRRSSPTGFRNQLVPRTDTSMR